MVLAPEVWGVLCLSDTPARYQPVEDRVLFDVLDGLLVRNHCEVVAIALKYLIAHP